MLTKKYRCFLAAGPGRNHVEELKTDKKVLLDPRAWKDQHTTI